MSDPAAHDVAHGEPLASVVTADEQAASTPQTVVDRLLAGNARFASGGSTRYDYRAQVAASVGGQYPLAIVLSCVDSRVPVEAVFDCGIGEIFVARLAGNVVNDDVLGSMEFACAAAGAKVVMVLGHQHCGAVKGAIAEVELGNLTGLLGRISPSVDAVSSQSGPAGDPDDADFVQAVAEHNVAAAVAAIRAESPVLADLESSDKITIVGAFYSLDQGTVRLI
jgi:carbonic anhydrase